MLGKADQGLFNPIFVGTEVIIKINNYKIILRALFVQNIIKADISL